MSTLFPSKQEHPQEIVFYPELERIIVANSLADDDATKLRTSCGTIFKTLLEWETIDQALIIEDVSQADDIAKAKAGKKAVKDARIQFRKDWESVKVGYRRITDALDAINRFVKSRIEPLEESLEYKSKFIEQMQAKERELRLQERSLQLQALGFDPNDVPGLADLPDQTWSIALKGYEAEAKEKAEAAERAAAEAKAEADRIEAEKMRLANRERLGRDRREMLLKEDADIPWEQLCDLTEEEFQAKALEVATANATKRQHAQNKIDRELDLAALGVNDHPFAEDWYYLEAFERQISDIATMDAAAWITELDVWKAEKARIDAALEASRKRDQLAIERKAEIVALGGEIVPTGVKIGEVSIDLNDLALATEDEWSAIIARVKSEKARIDDLAAKEKAENDLLFHRVSALLGLGCGYIPGTSVTCHDLSFSEKEILAADAAQWEKILGLASDTIKAADEAKAKLERFYQRKLALERIGALNDPIRQSLVLGDALVAHASLADLSENDFQEVVQQFEHARDRIAEAKVRASHRHATLVSLGQAAWSLEDCEKFSDESWQMILEDAKEKHEEAARITIQAEQDRKAAEEAERLASASDKTKIESLINSLSSISYPECVSIVGVATVEGAKQRIMDLIAEIKKVHSEMS